MNYLLAYSCEPPSSPLDPNPPIPLGILKMHMEMLDAQGIDIEFPTYAEQVRFSLLYRHWDMVRQLGALYYKPHSTLAAEPSRAAFIAAMRTMDQDALRQAYRRCVEEGGGLQEIEQEWQHIVHLSEVLAAAAEEENDNTDEA